MEDRWTDVVGPALEERLDMLGYTHDQFTAGAPFSRSTWYRVREGYRPSLRTIHRIEEALMLERGSILELEDGWVTPEDFVRKPIVDYGVQPPRGTRLERIGQGAAAVAPAPAQDVIGRGRAHELLDRLTEDDLELTLRFLQRLSQGA